MRITHLSLCCVALSSYVMGNFWHGINRKATTKLIAQTTNMSSAEIQKALSFWQKKYTTHFRSWAIYYPLVSDIIRTHGCRVGCEVGIAFGTQSEHILRNTGVEKLYSIDPYVPYKKDIFPQGSSKRWMDVLALCVAERLKQFGEQSHFIRKKSLDAALSFDNESLDFVYIDADHSYEAVKADLAVWYEKIRPDGILIGDDYGHRSFPGLKRAVDEFVRNNKLNLHLRRGGKYFIVNR